MTDPPNCQGFGRIRHFRRTRTNWWPSNPLPIEPVSKALGLGPLEELRAQVFQNAGCNWRCWYCFVDYKLLSANLKYSKMHSADWLMDRYLEQDDPPRIIDLSGGQPDLTPEWVLWMIQELDKRGLSQSVFLWSDDNLSNDYFWRYLSAANREMILSYRNYAKVCCFKGFDEVSFSHNTGANPTLFSGQLDLFARQVKLGLDLYCYVTLTTPQVSNIDSAMSAFVDKLQRISHYLPLRTVPLEIVSFSPVRNRHNQQESLLLQNQHIAVNAWSTELQKRFSTSELGLGIVDTPLRA